MKSILCLLLLVMLKGMAAESKEKPKQLVVMSAPRSSDAYYAKMYNKIINFQIEYAKKILKHDDVVILADSPSIKLFLKHLPKKILLPLPAEDIWMRDFTAIFPKEPVQFRYTAAAQGGEQKEADFVQKKFNQTVKKMGMKLMKSKYLLDGGNTIYDENKVIVTDRFLKDNKLSYKEGKRVLKQVLRVDQVAIIPSDDPKGLAHADGMVSFIENDVLLVNRYKGKFRKDVLSELKASFPTSKIVEVPFKIDKREWDKKISSACGVNLNVLVTNRAVYVPVFGNEIDAKVLEVIRKNTKKKVVAIDAAGVCIMGGSARCLTWQIQGDVAEKVLRYINGRKWDE